jgi:hypothetical protein
MGKWVILLMAMVFAAPALAEDPIRIEGSEQGALTDQFPDGGLPPVVGVENFQVFRACRDMAYATDGKGWTYNHHVDLACWKGRLYVGWENGQKDEDTFPGHEVISSSLDGVLWSAPREIFPVGLSNTMRMDFYLAKNGRMLLIAARRVVFERVTNVTEGGVVVREMIGDGSLGPIFTLMKSPEAPQGPAYFGESADAGFRKACELLLADHTFLEEQDGGALLGDGRMKPYEDAASDFGKAFCFFHRPDGTLVGICKKGYVVTSSDEGITWNGPTQLQDLEAGTAKEWIQQIPGGQYTRAEYIWAHDPFPAQRYPLVMMSGTDGVVFRNMRVVHGEVPRQRYAGLSKNIGPQYVRGLSVWNNDGSRNDNAIWLGYSVNKEDVWVSRIPLPVQADGAGRVDDEFSKFAAGKIVGGKIVGGKIIPGWNTYCPKWGDVSVGQNGLSLEDHDPYDYVRADRVFRDSSSVNAEFEVSAAHIGKSDLEIELWNRFSDVRPVRVVMNPDGTISAAGTTVGRFSVGKGVKFEIEAKGPGGVFTVSVDGAAAIQLNAVGKTDSFDRIVFRTGAYRLLPVKGDEVPGGTDRPAESSRYLLGYLKIGAG